MSGEDLKRKGDFVMDKDDFTEKTVEEQLGENIAKEVVGEIKKEIKPLFDLVKGIFTQLISTETKQLSYEEVMKYLLAQKKDNPKIKKGAIIREEAEGKIMITATFLDTENNVVNNKL
ncbi:MAG: hypothetical protein LBT24_04590, partial [Tannerella sp.]|nr:hypothetical protein [Tannerella sp.]